MIEIPQLTDAEKTALRALHAHRFPQGAKVPVLGDGGARLLLPMLLGNPSGACRMPSGSHVAPVWAETMRALATGTVDGSTADPLVADCMLWPTPAIFATWCERWPGIEHDIGLVILKMIGAASAIDEPSPVEEVPPEIAAALEQHPRAVWRHLQPPGARYEVAIEMPDVHRFEVYDSASARATDAELVALARELAEAQTVCCLEAAGKAYKAHPVAEMFDRFPGLVIFVAAQARKLGKAQGEILLGEF